MPPRNWRVRIQDILMSIAKIERYTASLSYEDFIADESRVDAVILNLIRIGEAARSISPDIEHRYPEIPWNRMRGMRNMIVHEYFRVSLPVVWQTVQTDLPPLVAALTSILDSVEADEQP